MKTQLWVFVILMLFLIVYGLPPSCTKDFCKKIKCANSSECDYVIPEATECKCCDICVTHLSEGARCYPPDVSSAITIHRKDCGPHLICSLETQKCVRRDDTTCLKMLNKFKKEDQEIGIQHIGVMQPSCNKFGAFNPVTCRPGSTCFCVDKEKGERLFGTVSMKLRRKTKCECSRDFVKMDKLLSSHFDIKADETQRHFLMCLENGDYDRLQCTDGKCFCINATLHQIGNVVEEKNKGKLPCYDLHIHDSAIYSLCYKEFNKLDKRKKQLEALGNTVIGMEFPACDLDGSYSPKQCRNTECVCVDRENKPIQIDEKIYSIERYTRDEEMKCYCAREQLYQLQSGQSVSVECDELGNYSPIQCVGSLCFCVDKNGIQFTEEFDISEREDFSCEDWIDNNYDYE